MNAYQSNWERAATRRAVDPDFHDVLLAHEDDLDEYDMPLDGAWPANIEDALFEVFLAARNHSVETTIWGGLDAAGRDTVVPSAVSVA